MYLKCMNYEMWLEMLDNRQWWYEYDHRLCAFSLRAWRFYVIVNRRKN